MSFILVLERVFKGSSKGSSNRVLKSNIRRFFLSRKVKFPSFLLSKRESMLMKDQDQKQVGQNAQNLKFRDKAVQVQVSNAEYHIENEVIKEEGRG